MTVHPDYSLYDIFKMAVEMIPPSWQYPEITCCRIIYNEKEFKTKNYVETKWKQTADIIISGEKKGAIEVYYLKEKPESAEKLFLREEKQLINSLGEQLGIIAEKKEMEEELNKQHMHLEKLVEERTAELLIEMNKRKKSEEKIKQQNVQLKKLNELKSAVLNVTSHELRTPMTAMKGYLQMLIGTKFGKLTDEQMMALDVVLRNTNRLDNLIQDILDVSRLESGTMKFIPSKIDVKQLVNEVTETMQLSANIKDISIQAYVEEGLSNLFIDMERIKQVLINLLNNAIKYSKGGSVINIKALKDKNDVFFEVEDYGRGIPKDKQDKIFEAFYQVDSGKDQKFGGAGLGLAISHGIVITHGGKIWVDSVEGMGSTFSFTLPLKPVKGIEEKFKAVDMFGLRLKGENIND